MEYVVEVEVAGGELDLDEIDQVLDALVDFAPGITTRPGTGPIIHVNVHAGSLRAAVTTALALVGELCEPVGVHALPETTWTSRRGWPAIPELINAADAADLLHVTRQRVLQMVADGKLPGVRVGSSWVFSRIAIRQIANERATTRKPQTIGDALKHAREDA